MNLFPRYHATVDSEIWPELRKMGSYALSQLTQPVAKQNDFFLRFTLASGRPEARGGPWGPALFSQPVEEPPNDLDKVSTRQNLTPGHPLDSGAMNPNLRYRTNIT